MKQKVKLPILVLLGVGLFSLVIFTQPAQAASTIVVNSTADDQSDDGECTLREAIIAANTDTASGAAAGECIAGSGVDTINFNLTGTADFVNGGQSGYTIKPQSALPSITQTVTINGYSQPNALANTAPAPQPLNGRVLIELDGSGAGTNVQVFRFDTGSDNSLVRGLAIGNFSDSDAIMLVANNVSVQGNYIGTNPAGTAAKPNGIGLTHGGSGSGQNALIGGLNPADRNIISGNNDGSTATGAYPATGWVIQGNYVGVGVDGTSPIPNAPSGGPGAFSVDDCSDVLIGGTSPGAANVISGNTSYGLAPHNSPGLTVAGNLIGVDWTGKSAVPNQVGVLLSGDQTGTVIGGTSSTARNIISGNAISGILSSTSGRMQIQGNYIGLDVDGVEAISNGAGVIISDDAILGGSVAARNVISGNSLLNVTVQGLQTPTSGAEVSGNYIGTNASGRVDPAITNAQGEGIRISANTSENIIGGEYGNVIAGNRGAGVSVRTLTVTQFSVTATPTKNAVLGNQIYGNEAGGPLDGPGLGIDLYQATMNAFSGLPLDLQADSYVGIGPTQNDNNDADTGPNGYINFPTLNSAKQTGNQATINFDLDAAGSPTDQYRVEFFANDAADPSGHGEGQTFLGSTTVSNGANQQTSLTLPTNLSLANKSISATTTAVDATTDSGFGGTSEFSLALAANVDGSVGGSLASTGGSVNILTLVSISLIALGGGLVILRVKHV